MIPLSQPEFAAVPAAESVGDAVQEQLAFRLTGAQKKTAYALRQNVETMICGLAPKQLVWRDLPDGRSKRLWVCEDPENLNCCAFLTLTVGDTERVALLCEGDKPNGFIGPMENFRDHFRQVWDAAEANRRVNNLNRRVLPALFERWVIVTERHKSGAIHYHAVGILKDRPDIRTGFNFAAVRGKNYSSVSPTLSALWANLRDVLPRYGFGRSELTPIEHTSEQIASYVSKYIEKNLFARCAEDKRKKLVRYGGWDGSQLKPNSFSWAGEQARQWRFRSRVCGGILGVQEREEMKTVLGPRWAFAVHKLIQWQETWPVPFWEMTDYEFRIFGAEVKHKAILHFRKSKAEELRAARFENEIQTRRHVGKIRPLLNCYVRELQLDEDLDGQTFAV